MGLVDLRGRADEPRTRTLLLSAHASGPSLSAALKRYHDGRWTLIGWEDDGRVVACIGVERAESGDVVVRSIAVAQDRREQGLGRSLVDALAAVVNARQLVAETDDDAVGFYRRCGFSIEETGLEAGRVRYRCTRPIEPRPASAEAVRAVTCAELEGAIRASWGRDTSDDADEWSEDNPARGQCVGTALLVRELLGGEILLANVLRDGQRVERHAWNRLPSGLAVDLTRSQFRNGEEFEEPVAGEPLMANHERYDLLARRVQRYLQRASPR
jgi:N-acetylglutamate synthase-like GNAT family acetyltransferase